MTRQKKHRSKSLTIGALGVVFGDLGTSPLYALGAVFALSRIPINQATVIGIVSLIFWTILLVVSLQYVLLIMRASNKGEGGIMALVGLLSRYITSKSKKNLIILCGLVGVSLFYGDSVITPAISVLSSVEGAKSLFPDITHFIVPCAVILLLGLFVLQSRGTGTIGRYFGPILLIWFIVSAIGGLTHIIANPSILQALSPLSAYTFLAHHTVAALAVFGGVVLVVTGVEALYADMGHFGRRSVAKAWFFIVFPALTLTYLGQGALILDSPAAASNPYFGMFPTYLQPVVIVLAMTATLIASQAVISGAFSLTKQAIQLGFAPRLLVRHTSEDETGQIYIPSLNWILAVIVTLLVMYFGSSTRLADAYGMAVSAAVFIDASLFIALLFLWRASWRRLTIVVMVPLICINLLFMTANTSKIVQGAWLPILIALISFTLLSTWRRGRMIIAGERQQLEGSLKDFVHTLHRTHINRVPGRAVYIGHHPGNAPLALHDSVHQLHELHEKVVIVNVETVETAHMPVDERVIFDELDYPNDGISHVTLRFGYKDASNVPLALERARSQSKELNFNPHTASYFISHDQPIIATNHKMMKWRKHLYAFMQRNANNTSEFLHLPADRTVEMTTFIEL